MNAIGRRAPARARSELLARRSGSAGGDLILGVGAADVLVGTADDIVSTGAVARVEVIAPRSAADVVLAHARARREVIVPGLSLQLVVAGAPDQQVVPVAARDVVVAGAGEDDVVPGTRFDVVRRPAPAVLRRGAADRTAGAPRRILLGSRLRGQALGIRAVGGDGEDVVAPRAGAGIRDAAPVRRPPGVGGVPGVRAHDGVTRPAGMDGGELIRPAVRALEHGLVAEGRPVRLDLVLG